jgi:hypothetical protein
VSAPIRRALYGKLAGDTTLGALLAQPPSGWSHSIYHQQAPEGAQFPYVIFQKQSGTPAYALGAKAYDEELWLVKGVDRQADGDADPVDAISARLDALLTDAALSISGRTQLYLRRISDVEYPEAHGDQRFLHAGFLLRLVYQ